MGVARTISFRKVLAAAMLIVAQAAFAAGASRAAEGPTLPPAEFKPLPVGTRIVYDNAIYVVAKQDGFTTVFKKQIGGTITWVNTHALFGEYGTDLYVRSSRGSRVEFDLDAGNRKKLESLWPLAVGKETTYRMDEPATGAYQSNPQVWTIVLKVSGTEIIDTGSGARHTYVIEERAESDGGMSFSGRKWYDPASGLIVRSWRKGTGANSFGAVGWGVSIANLGKDQEETLALRKVDFPPGTAPAVVAGDQATTKTAKAGQAEGPALPPAAYKPLPVGTKVEYNDRAFTVARTDGYTTVLKKETRSGATSWIQTHAVFGEYGRDVYATDAHSEPVEYDIGSENKGKLEALWPLAVGKETTYLVKESGPKYYGEPQNWTIALKVTGTETVNIGGGRYQTYVIDEQAISDGGMAFVGRRWYHPASGVVVRSQRTGTGIDRYRRTIAHLGKDQESSFALRKVDFPPGTDAEVVAAAQGATATGKTELAEVERLMQIAEQERQAAEAIKARQAEEQRAREAKLAQLNREIEERRKATAQQSEREARELKEKQAQIARLTKEAEEKQRAEEAKLARSAAEAKAREAEVARRLKVADEARKARETEIAQLQREAEQVFKAREAEMAKRFKEADEARKAEIAKLKQEAELALKAREAEIAKVKQEAEQALKAREAEMERLKQTLAERRDDKAGAAGDVAAAFGGVDFGRYHALVIGIDNYKELPRLKTAISDARAVAEVLEKDYGFSVTLLIDPDAREIVDRLDVYRETLGPKDNLLIYYAGHGWLDKEADRGYWLPVDAKPKRRSGWVSNATVSDTLKTLTAKHVMVVADSCYSGTLVRGADVGARTRTGDYWKRMAEKWARVAITSGGLEPVADAGGGGHSPFAKAFIDALGANASVIDGTQLFSHMRRPVMTAAQQTPQYADVREAGHDGGDFLFVRKKN